MKRKKLDIIDPFRDQLFQNKDSITRKLEKLVPFLYSNTDCKLKKKEYSTCNNMKKPRLTSSSKQPRVTRKKNQKTNTYKRQGRGHFTR